MRDLRFLLGAVINHVSEWKLHLYLYFSFSGDKWYVNCALAFYMYVWAVVFDLGYVKDRFEIYRYLQINQ